MSFKNRHICFSKDLSCTGINPCMVCQEKNVEQLLPKILEHVLPSAMREAQLTLVQGQLLVRTFYALLASAYKEGLKQFHQLLEQDKRLLDEALDLQRYTLKEIGTSASSVADIQTAAKVAAPTTSLPAKTESPASRGRPIARVTRPAPRTSTKTVTTSEKPVSLVELTVEDVAGALLPPPSLPIAPPSMPTGVKDVSSEDGSSSA